MFYSAEIPKCATLAKFLLGELGQVGQLATHQILNVEHLLIFYVVAPLVEPWATTTEILRTANIYELVELFGVGVGQ